MPKKKENAKIALVNSALEIEKTEMSAEIRIRDPNQEESVPKPRGQHAQRHGKQDQSLRSRHRFLQKGIDDMVQHYLSEEGIMAARRVKESDMEKLAEQRVEE